MSSTINRVNENSFLHGSRTEFHCLEAKTACGHCNRFPSRCESSAVTDRPLLPSDQRDDRQRSYDYKSNCLVMQTFPKNIAGLILEFLGVTWGASVLSWKLDHFLFGSCWEDYAGD